MGSNSMSDYPTQEQITQMQDFLLAHPIDRAYDEMCSEFNDSLEPNFLLQIAARAAYNTLKSLGRLPEGIE